MARSCKWMLAGWLALSAAGASAAVDPAVADAQRAVTAGDLATAEYLYGRALEAQPASIDARLGRAYVRSWQRRYPDARADFEAVLAADPRNVQALTGLGYNQAWAGERGDAAARFRQALAVEPTNADAEKGLSLYEGRPPLRGELTLLGGLSALSGRSELGVRFAEAALAPTDRTRLWLQYDDSLTLDSLGLARQNARAPAFYAGGLLAWGDGLVSRLELGYRDLDGVSEAILRGEQVVLAGGDALKAGGSVGYREDGRWESVVHGGVELPLRRGLALEPTAFWGHTGPGEDELRLQLAGAWRPRGGAELAAGLAAGHAFAPAGGAEGTVLAGFLRGSLPLGSRVRGQLLLSREAPPVGGAVTVFAVGVTVLAGRLP